VSEEGKENQAVNLDQLYRESAPWLRGVGYRICGDVAVAEDLLQESFLRVLVESDLEKVDRDALLASVARLAVGALQARQSGNYRGSWLPTPVQTDLDEPEAREEFGHRSTLSFDLLCALEGVDVVARAAYILAEMRGGSPEQIAGFLEQPAAKVEMSLVETRLRLDRERFSSGNGVHREEKNRLVQALGTGLGSGAGEFPRDGVAPSLKLVFDHGGTCNAPENQLCAPAVAMKILQDLLGPAQGVVGIEVAEVNFLPALMVDLGERSEGEAERMAILPSWDQEGVLGRVQIVLAPGKLRALSFDGLRPSLGEIL
jgi:DNA-directed RNA polymerase specialized sigma24 family protein